MGRKVGVPCNTIIVLQEKKPKPADCAKCRNGSCMDGKIYCNVSGSLKPVNKQVCRYYKGAYISWEDVEIKKKPKRNRKKKGRKNISHRGKKRLQQ